MGETRTLAHQPCPKRLIEMLTGYSKWNGYPSHDVHACQRGKLGRRESGQTHDSIANADGEKTDRRMPLIATQSSNRATEFVYETPQYNEADAEVAGIDVICMVKLGASK